LQIPRVIFETFLFVGIVYFTANIGRDVETFFNFVMAISLSGICAMSYGFLLAALFDSVFIATELSGIVDLIMMLVAGVYINVKFTPWIKYISFFFYANETVFINFWLTVDAIKCSDNIEHPCLTNGTVVLENLGFGTTTDVIYADYLYQLILTLLTHVIAFFGVRRNVRKTGFY